VSGERFLGEGTFVSNENESFLNIDLLNNAFFLRHNQRCLKFVVAAIASSGNEERIAFSASFMYVLAVSPRDWLLPWDPYYPYSCL